MIFQNIQLPAVPAVPAAPQAPSGLPATPAIAVRLADLQVQKAALDAQWTSLRRQLEGMTQTNVARPAVAQEWGNVSMQRAQVEGEIARLRAQLRQQGVPEAGTTQPSDRGPSFYISPEVPKTAAILLMIVIALPLSIAWAQRIARRGKTPPPAPVPQEDAGRLERMEQAIDAIAIEVERISEAQRFLTKVMADKGNVAAAPPAAAPAVPALGAGPAEPIVASEREAARVSR